MKKYTLGQEDALKVEALKSAQRELRSAERRGNAERYFLVWEKYDSLIRSTDGIARNEELYEQGMEIAEHKARASSLLEDRTDLNAANLQGRI